MVVSSNKNLLDNSQNWEEIFPQLTDQIAEHTGYKLIDALTCNFSTSTSVEKIASEITILDAMKSYFEYVVIYFACGIPEITLLGTTEDWEKVYSKAKYLEKYNLEWWTDELEPILKEFISASKGKIRKRFWRNMFKTHSPEVYGAPDVIDGWIVKFFPYDKDGGRNNLEELNGTKSLPDEIVKVDLKYIEDDAGVSKEVDLELWSGFIGLQQNSSNFSLTPQIGWLVKKKDAEQKGYVHKLELENGFCVFDGISIRILDVPIALKNLKEIYNLSLHFKKDVFIPEWMKDIRIGNLYIKGNITQSEKDKIINLLPNTFIRIQDSVYNVGKNGCILVEGNLIAEEILKKDKIWVLNIINNNNKFKVPEELKNIEIEILCLMNKISAENIEKLKELLPNTKIYVSRERIQ